MNQNYQMGVKYEYGMEVEKNYQKAYEHYYLALQEGEVDARDKVKYKKISIKQILILIFSLVIGLLIDIFSVYPWKGIFVISIINIASSLYYHKKYWIKTGFPSIFTITLFYFLAVILLPISFLYPYLKGVTWIPVVMVFTVSFFATFALLVIFLIDKNIKVIKFFFVGLYLFLLTIISFNIDTEDKQFIFTKVYGGVEITGYRYYEKDLVIPSKLSGYKVIGIASNAFSNLQFETITFSNSLEYIGNSAFSGNRLIKEISIPDGVVLGRSVFADNYNLEVVKLPNDLEEINDNLFFNNLNLSEIIIPDTVVRIGDNAFNNTNLKAVTLPSNLIDLGNDVFSNTKIKVLNLPNTIINLGSLSNMALLEEVNIPNSISYLPANFLSYNKAIKHLDIPDNIKQIGSYAFSYTNIEEVNFPNDITYMGDGLFYYNQGIKNVLLPNTLNYIPRLTFAFSSIESFHIESYINSIENGAFLNAKNLTSITIDEGIKYIDQDAFSNNESLVSVILPNTINSIGSNVFKDAKNLENITLSNNLTEIPRGAFDGARKLSVIDLPDGITKIGSYAFRNSNIVNLTLPNELILIENHAFYSNVNLETISFNNKLESIGVYSFGDNFKLTNINLPTSLNEIKEHGFNGSNNLINVTFNSNVSNVGYYAFKTSPLMTIYIDDINITESWHKEWTPYDISIIVK